MTTAIAVAYGNQPELLEAVLPVVRASGADIVIETVEVGQRIYNMQSKKGVLPSSWEVLERIGILLKSPTAAPKDDYAEVSASIYAHFELTDEHRTQHSHTTTAQATSHINERFALFEVAREDASLCSMLLASIMLLKHIHEDRAAQLIERSWQLAIEDGIKLHKLSPDEFTEELLFRMGR